jgi:LysM repeat protein
MRALSSKITRRLIGLVATLALTLGISFGAAPPASAAKTVWDKVASCESGGRWNINTHNGYYGGLQFSSRTWKGFGGKKYASNAHKATKGEQIAIARRVLAGQGPKAWSSCGRKAKLTKKNGKANKKATPATNPGAKKASKPASKPAKKPTATPVSSTSKTVRVKSGDTLAKIAKRNHVDGGWRGLWELNKKTVKNPNNISVGQVLKID